VKIGYPGRGGTQVSRIPEDLVLADPTTHMLKVPKVMQKTGIQKKRPKFFVVARG
jgi:hypothetical protein